MDLDNIVTDLTLSLAIFQWLSIFVPTFPKLLSRRGIKVTITSKCPIKLSNRLVQVHRQELRLSPSDNLGFVRFNDVVLVVSNVSLVAGVWCGERDGC